MLWSVCSEKPVFVSTFLPFCPVSFWSQLVYSRWGVETRFYFFRRMGLLRSSHGRDWSRTLVAPLQWWWPPGAYDFQWHLQSHSQPGVHRRPHSRNTFLPSRRKWNQDVQVETAFELCDQFDEVERNDTTCDDMHISAPLHLSRFWKSSMFIF